MLSEPVCLLMDQFGTHTTEAMINKSEAWEIAVIWIAKGATGRSQPLDRLTFEALWAKGKAEWRHQFAEPYGMGCIRKIATQLLLLSWSDLLDSAVGVGWDYGKGVDEEEESDESNSEFHLQMATDTDDEDIIALWSENGEDAEAESTQPEEP
jgi:hypothetical protein